MAIRRAFIWLLAAIFVVAGTVARISPMLPAMAQDHHAAMASAPDAQHGHAAHQGDAAHQGHGDHDAVAAMAEGHDHAQPTDIEHDDCLKCCTMCGVTSLTAGYPGTPVYFAYGTVRFHVGQRQLLDHPVPLDPDIPKSVV